MILGRYTPEEYAAFWGCDPCYDTPPRLPGDGYLFYNFGSERQFRDQDYLTRLLGAIDRTIPITMTSPPRRGRVSDRRGLRQLRRHVSALLQREGGTNVHG